LPRHSVHHFSCHGSADLERPSRSALHLADGPLTLADVQALKLLNRQTGGVRLAVLSACESAMAGTLLPDEVVSLPTGLLQAGLAAVVGTLWAISGISSALIATRFYDSWQRHSLAPPMALRAAQCWVRDSTNREKADYLKALLDERGDQAVRQLWRTFVLAPPDELQHSHPLHWAAFAYAGE
jgi:CHAT domain-containing protein